MSLTPKDTLIMKRFFIFVFTCFFPALGVGLLDFKLNSISTLLLAWSTPRSSLECPTPECPTLSVPRVPNSRVPKPKFSLECSTPECPWSAQPQSVPGVPNHRGSLPTLSVTYLCVFILR